MANPHKLEYDPYTDKNRMTVTMAEKFQYGGPGSMNNGRYEKYDNIGGSSRRTQADTNIFGTRETDAKKVFKINTFRVTTTQPGLGLLERNKFKKERYSNTRYQSLNKMESHLVRQQSPSRILEVKNKKNTYFGSSGFLHPYHSTNNKTKAQNVFKTSEVNILQSIKHSYQDSEPMYHSTLGFNTSTKLLQQQNYISNKQAAHLATSQ